MYRAIILTYSAILMLSAICTDLQCYSEYGGILYGDILQWDLSIKDTLGPANLFTVERLSTLQR